MSKVALAGDALGTGTFTIAAPNSNTNRTLTLPDSSGVLLNKTEMGATGDAPVFACRAWVNFDGTRDSTGAVSTANTNRFIRASANVASVLRVATGDYAVTFTTAMPDSNYAVLVTPSNDPTARIIANTKALSSSSVPLTTYNVGTSAFADNSLVCVAIFR